MSGLPPLPPPPPPPPPAPPAAPIGNLESLEDGSHHQDQFSNDGFINGFNQVDHPLTDNLLYHDPTNQATQNADQFDSFDANHHQQFDSFQQSNPIDSVSSNANQNFLQSDQHQPAEWIDQQHQSLLDSNQLQPPPIDHNYLPEMVVQDHHEQQFDSFDYNDPHFQHGQDGDGEENNQVRNNKPTKFQAVEPDDPSHAFWRGKTHPLESEDLGLQQGEVEEPNYFTKNVTFTPEEKRMVIHHLASRGPTWERKVKGFKVCEDLIVLNPTHTKFSYNNFLRRSMTEEAAASTLRRAVRRAQVLLGIPTEEATPINSNIDDDGSAPPPDSNPAAESELDQVPIPSFESPAMVASTSASSSNNASESRDVSIPASASPSTEATVILNAQNGSTSASASTSISEAQNPPKSRKRKPSTSGILDQPKRRNPFTQSDVEQIVEYISNLDDFPSEKFQDTMCTELAKLNESHTKFSYSSFLKDNTFGQGRKLEEVIAKRRSEKRRLKRKQEVEEQGGKGKANGDVNGSGVGIGTGGYESEEEVWKGEAKRLEGLFRPTSLGIIRRRKQELIEKEKQKEKEKDVVAEPSSSVEEGEKRDSETTREKVEGVATAAAAKKRRKSNPKSIT